MAVDPAGNGFVVGRPGSVDYPVRGPYRASLRGGQQGDAFVAKVGSVPLATPAAKTTASPIPSIAASSTAGATIAASETPTATATPEPTRDGPVQERPVNLPLAHRLRPSTASARP